MNLIEVQRLLAEKQYYFLPLYEEVVSSHPEGIGSGVVKERVRRLIQERHGFDPYDAEVVGTNPSGAVRSTQWARNLISNEVLDEVMIVDRHVRPRRLFPRLEPTTGTPIDATPSWPEITTDVNRALGQRDPRRRESSTTVEYARIPAIAEHVRQIHHYSCVVDSDDCAVFAGRDGCRYIEVHHLYPMRCQGDTEYNLDRSENMVAVCTICHAKLHHGSPEVARDTLALILDGYRAHRGTTHAEAIAESGLDCELDALLAQY